MAAPQNKFGFSSNCIFCQDHQLDMIAADLGAILLIIAVISLFAGFMLRAKNVTSPLLTMVTVSLLFFTYYKETWTSRADFAIHAMGTHHQHVERPFIDTRKIIDEYQQFQRYVSLKGWAIFSLTPFGIGFAAGAMRRRFWAPSK